MKPETIFSNSDVRRRAMPGLVALAAVIAGGLSGCATAGGDAAGGGASSTTGEAAAPAQTVSVAERDFYADWYEASAVVLPPPPSATGAGKR